MNKVKKLLVLILSVIALLCMTLGVVGCSQKEIELVGFDDITVEGVLYEDFSVAGYLMAVDTEDNVYKGTVEVTDSDNNPVELSFNRFVPETLEPYTARVSVDLPDGETKTRIITIEIKDKSRPKFEYSSELYTGTVGSAYELPTITATKPSGDVLTATTKVYFNDNGTDKEQTVTDGKFIPQAAGKYTLSAIVTDKYGYEYEDKRTVTIRPQMAANMLEDFGHANSIENATGGLNLLNDPSTGIWHETFTDSEETTANGVVYFSIWYSNQVATGRLNKTETELKELIDKFDSITLRFMITRDGVEEFKFRFFGIEKTVPVGKWTAISVSKTEILSKMQGATEEEKIDEFAKTFSLTGSGVPQSGSRMFGSPVASTGVSLDVYVDSISFAKVEIAEYTAPSVAGGKFTLPAARIVDANGGTLCDEYEITATNGNKSLLVENNQIGVYSGMTTVKYNFDYDGVPYSAAFNFTLTERATMNAKYFEDYGDGQSNVNAAATFSFKDNDGNEMGKGYSTWYETKADKNGDLAYGVVETEIYHSLQVLTVRFNRTEQEIIAMMEDLEYLTVRLMIHRDNVTQYNVKVMGVGQTINVDEWSVFLVSKADLLSNMAGDTEDEKIASFAEIYCSTGKGGHFISATCSGVSIPIWVDEIYAGTPELEENVLDDYTYGLSANNVASGAVDFSGNHKGTHYASLKDGEGTEAKGVVYGQMWYSNQVLPVRFNRTESELLSIMQDLETLTVRLLIKRDGVTTFAVRLFGVSKEIPVNKWTEITVTRAEILNNLSGSTETEKIANFANNFCSTGLGGSPRLFGASVASSGVSLDMYFDSITFTK